MVRLRKKLQSERGASILLALLMLLVCMMVAASVLAAAASNAGKARSNRVEQQKYLTLSSAIQLVADELQKAEYTGKYTLYTWTVEHKNAAGIVISTENFCHIAQTEGSYSCDELTDQIPLQKELDGIFSKQFTGTGYTPLSDVEDSTERILTVTLPDVTGYPDSGPAAYQISKVVTVKVVLDHATHHITLTAWLGGDAAPADGSDTMTAELVSKVKKTDASGNPVLEDGNPLVTVSPPAGATAETPAAAGAAEENGTTATITWQLHWIKKGGA